MFRRRRKPASTKRVLGVHRDWRQGERRFYCRAGDESGVIVMEDGEAEWELLT